MAESEGGGGSARVRTWIGLLAVATGTLLVGDPSHRAHAAWEWTIAWWPWVFVALASVNLLRSAVPAGALIGPLLLAGTGAVGLAVSGGVDRHLAQGVLVPLALTSAGVSLVLSAAHSGHTTTWTRLLASGAVVISSDADGPLTVRAVLGELRADLRHLGKETEVNVNVTALAGYVRLTVPLHSDVIVHTPGTILTRVTVQEPGQVEIPLRTRDYTVHVLGVCGAVSIVRA